MEQTVSHFERLSLILGATLLGIAAVLIRQGRNPGARKESVPVEKLADNLREAWAGYHNR